MVRKGRGGNGWENSIRRKPFADINQNSHLNSRERTSRKTFLPGPQYVIKTETVGVKNCPVHGKEKFTVLGKSSGPLAAPSLIRRNSINLGRIKPVKSNFNQSNGRPK